MSECIVTPATVLLYIVACILVVGLTIRFLMWVFCVNREYVVMRPDNGLYYCGLRSGNNTIWGASANAMLLKQKEAEAIRAALRFSSPYVTCVVVEVRQ